MDDRRVSVVIGILVCFLGMASWIDINGLWVELPLLVNALPEGWNLPSYMVVIIQVANIGPLIFTLISKFTKLQLEIPTNYLIISVGAMSCLLLAFFWNETSYFNGVEHSTALLCLSFCLALVDCTSSVSFLAFMSIFPLKYMTPYFIGEGLSGLIPALVGLVQGVGGNSECVNTSYVNQTTNTTSYQLSYYNPPPRFSIEVFFFILAAMLACSLTSFVLLNYLPIAKYEKIKNSASENNSPNMEGYNVVANKLGESGTFELDKSSSTSVQKEIQADLEWDSKYRYSNKDEMDIMKPDFKQFMKSWDWVFLMVLLAWSSALVNSVMPSIQSYSALPYGNISYHLAVTLAQIANPVTCLVVLLLPTRHSGALGMISLLGTGAGAYIMWIALMSPHPLLCGSVWGEAFVVLAWILLVGFLTYVRVMIGVICRDNGRKALIWCGAAMQTGSLIGSIIIFPLVNTLKLFTPNDPCGETCWT